MLLRLIKCLLMLLGLIVLAVLLLLVLVMFSEHVWKIIALGGFTLVALVIKAARESPPLPPFLQPPVDTAPVHKPFLDPMSPNRFIPGTLEYEVFGAGSLDDD